MKPRRKHRGMLTGLVKYPQEKHRKGKPPSLLKRVGSWIVGTVVVLALIGFLVVIFWGLFHPGAGRPDAGEFTVMELVPDPPGYPPEDHVTAAAFVIINGRRVPIRLTAETQAGVEIGSTLHVDYVFLPKYGKYDVKNWRLVSKAARPPAAPVAPPGS